MAALLPNERRALALDYNVLGKRGAEEPLHPREVGRPGMNQECFIAEWIIR
jgi:hypothetical protein